MPEQQATAQKIEEFPVRQPGFDMRTHIRDANTKRLVRIQPFAQHHMGRSVMYERPIGSGNMFNPNGDSIGHWALKEGRWNKISDEHAAVTPDPVSKEEYLERQNEDLRRELEALKAEQTSKLTGQKQAPPQKK